MPSSSDRARAAIGGLLAATVLSLGFPAAGSPAAASGMGLVEAAKGDLTADLVTQLRSGSDVNARDELGATALAWAVIRDNAASVKLLLEARADPNLPDVNSVTPLSLAVAADEAEIVQMLLDKGANPNAPRADGETPLMTAARLGSPKSVALLLSHGADVNLREAKFGQTALMWAAGHPEIVRMLLAHGADTGAVTKAWVITATNYTPITTTLGVTGIPWNNDGEYKMRAGGMNALLFAVQKNDLDSVQLLLGAGMDVNRASADGTTPLIAALYKWRTEAGRRLVYSPDLKLANFLLDRGANVNVADDAGYTPLHGAILSLLMQQKGGAQALSFNGTQRSDPKRPHPVPPPEEAPEIALVKRLLDAGADPNHQTVFQTPGPVNAVRVNPCPPGSSPLHVAAATHSARLVELLAQHGGNPNLVRKDGHTPFSVAVLNDDLPTVQVLVAHGADLKRRYDPTDEIPDPVESKTRRMKDQTILHIAALPGAEWIVDYLVANGAPLDAKNSLGQTPYDLAAAMQRFRYQHTIEATLNDPVRPVVEHETQMTDTLAKAMQRRALSSRGAKHAGAR